MADDDDTQLPVYTVIDLDRRPRKRLRLRRQRLPEHKGRLAPLPPLATITHAKEEDEDDAGSEDQQ